MIVHHLVVDAVSWRVIAEDFEAAYTNIAPKVSFNYQLRSGASVFGVLALETEPVDPRL